MFWSGNYIVVKEVNFLLKAENVTLTQVLEADDILQECKADNKALMQFLTKPKILAELITLITEEPPKNVELASQYRHASIACEVLTSQLSTLSDCLSTDVVQMNRLCDFINKDPPLNPLLASYFSKTVEMLLERSPKQDWYVYHVVCLRVLDFFKSRRDFLPNLLRHISTSAIADTFKYFIRLDDLFNKIIMEWFEEHQFLECLIQIICGAYSPEPLAQAHARSGDASPEREHEREHERERERPEKGQRELSEKRASRGAPQGEAADGDDGDKRTRSGSTVNNVDGSPAQAAAEAADEAERRARRIAAVASANAAALLCDLILSGCAGEGCNTRPRTSWALVSRLQAAEGVRSVLAGMFTAPAHARARALVNGAHVLQALLAQEPILGGECESERTSVELAVAPHLPLLHQALLEPAEPPGSVGLPRVQVAALLAHLARSELQEVASTMLTLGTPGVVVDMLFAFPHNNFLHAQAYALIKHALANRVYRTQYARHLLVECDLLTRLMDVFDENENKQSSSARSAYMGHVILALRRISKALEQDGCGCTLPAHVWSRWEWWREHALAPLLLRHDTPLGGYYPSENIYDVTATADLDDMPHDISTDAYNEMCAAADSVDFLADELDLEEMGESSKNNFLELASQRFGDDMWEDSPEGDEEREGDEAGEGEGEGADAGALSRVRELLEQHSPWESGNTTSEESTPGGEAAAGAGAGAGAGWAQFDAFAHDPFAPSEPPRPPPPPAQPPAAEGPSEPSDGAADQFAAFWSYGDSEHHIENAPQEIEAHMRSLSLAGAQQSLQHACSVTLAHKLLTAMSAMAPEVVADLVYNMPVPHQHIQPEQDLLESTNQLVQPAVQPSLEQKSDAQADEDHKKKEKDSQDVRNNPEAAQKVAPSQEIQPESKSGEKPEKTECPSSDKEVSKDIKDPEPTRQETQHDTQAKAASPPPSSGAAPSEPDPGPAPEAPEAPAAPDAPAPEDPDASPPDES